MQFHQLFPVLLLVALALHLILAADSGLDDDLDVLIERGNKMLAEAHRLYETHRNNSPEFLLPSIESEIRRLEASLKELQQLEKLEPNTRTVNLNKIEEKLLEHENSLAEEFAFVEDIYRNHIATNKTATELIEYGEILLKETKAELAKPQSFEIKYDLEVLAENIQRSINHTKESGRTDRQISMTEQLLIQNERELRNLLAEVHHLDKPPAFIDIDVLIDRADKMLDKAQKLLDKHRDTGRGHLLEEADAELKRLQVTVEHMKGMEKNSTDRYRKLNSLEEELLEGENRFWEEMSFVEEVYKAGTSASSKPGTELVAYGTALIKEARAELEKHKAEVGSRAIARTIAAVTAIEDLVKKIGEAQPSSQDEQILLRQEKTLRSYLQEIQHPGL